MIWPWNWHCITDQPYKQNQFSHFATFKIEGLWMAFLLISCHNFPVTWQRLFLMYVNKTNKYYGILFKVCSWKIRKHNGAAFSPLMATSSCVPANIRPAAAPTCLSRNCQEGLRLGRSLNRAEVARRMEQKATATAPSQVFLLLKPSVKPRGSHTAKLPTQDTEDW